MKKEPHKDAYNKRQGIHLGGSCPFVPMLPGQTWGVWPINRLALFFSFAIFDRLQLTTFNA